MDQPLVLDASMELLAVTFAIKVHVPHSSRLLCQVYCLVYSHAQAWSQVVEVCVSWHHLLHSTLHSWGDLDRKAHFLQAFIGVNMVVLHDIEDVLEIELPGTGLHILL